MVSVSMDTTHMAGLDWQNKQAEFKAELEKFDATFDCLIDYFAIIGFD
jgi:hypothetical protein